MPIIAQVAASKYLKDGFADIMERWTLYDIAENYRMSAFLADLDEQRIQKNTPTPPRTPR